MVTKQDTGKPADRTCSMCGNTLHAEVHGYTIDKDFNTVPCYMFGHICPAQTKAYNDRIKSINQNASMNDEQKRNATEMAGYMNAWGS
jgi:hypothetical protein